MTSIKILLSLTYLLAWTANVLGNTPNIILIITDDQGYGDIAAHGNKMIDTPATDKLWSESIRLTDYHVDPTCAPTRSALMTGRYSTRTGVWHTINGRCLMDTNELILPESLKHHGYATGLFGKWHLGDNYPFRPQDQGFETVVWHKAGGVGQGPDYWGNDYFDDTYWRGDTPEKFEGYCTDIWFEEGIQFIKANKDKPFFAYISTNAPHTPLNVDAKYSDPYEAKGVDARMAKFYGMITNIDENIAKLRQFLSDEGLSDNTILIFTSDNGTAGGVPKPSEKLNSEWKGFNAGMRGKKGFNYDGGHRVPFFIHWPAGKLMQGKDIDNLTAHIDIHATLLDLCGLEKPKGPPMDGISLKPLLYGQTDNFPTDRTLVVHSQRIETPQKWRSTAVMTERWRLTNPDTLNDIEADPGQTTNVAENYPEVVAELNKMYDGWWESFAPNFATRMRIIIGSSNARTMHLMSHDWIMDTSENSPYSQGHVRRGTKSSGYWAIEIAETGRYRITLRRWPKHLNRSMDSKHAKMEIAGKVLERSIDISDTKVVFEVDLESGPASLQSWITNSESEEYGAYFAEVTRL